MNQLNFINKIGNVTDASTFLFDLDSEVSIVRGRQTNFQMLQVPLMTTILISATKDSTT